MKQMLKEFWTDESGQGLTEYAVIIVLVSILLMGALTLFKGSLENVFNKITDELNTLTTG